MGLNISATLPYEKDLYHIDGFDCKISVTNKKEYYIFTIDKNIDIQIYAYKDNKLFKVKYIINEDNITLIDSENNKVKIYKNNNFTTLEEQNYYYIYNTCKNNNLHKNINDYIKIIEILMNIH